MKIESHQFIKMLKLMKLEVGLQKYISFTIKALQLKEINRS